MAEPNVKSAASGHPSVAITTKNIEEFRGDLTFRNGDLAATVWQLFDRIAFERSGTGLLVPIGKIVSTKDELREYVEKKKEADPRQKAFDKMVEASKGGKPRKPVTGVAREDGFVYVEDGNATVQVLMLSGWGGDVPVEIDVQPLIEIYERKRKEVKGWFEDVRNELQRWMEDYPYKRVHSVRARMKDVGHLKLKIPRKNTERFRKDRPLICKGNLFREIEDLAGARVLVLYRHEVAIVDHFVYQCNKWRVLKAEAKYDSNRPEDRKWFAEYLGFEDKAKFEETLKVNPDHPERILNAQENGYASIHYILVPLHVPSAGDHDYHHLKCELQVRTVHEEAWSEFSHEFSYPVGWVDPLAEQLIVRLSSMLHLAEDLVADIRQHPALARILRELYTSKGAEPVSTIAKLLEELPYLAKSAFLAGFGLLAPPDGTSGVPIQSDCIVTIGYDQPSYKKAASKQDPLLREIYRKAQTDWVKMNETKRQICKFTAQIIPRSHAEDKSQPPPEHLNYYIIPPWAYKIIHAELERFGLKRNSGYSLRRTQFFVWKRNGDEEIQSAKLPGSDENLFGFYAPTTDPDLLAGVLWFEQSDNVMFQLVQAYADLLLELRTNDKVIQAVRTQTQPPAESDAAKMKITEAVERTFGEVLRRHGPTLGTHFIGK